MRPLISIISLQYDDERALRYRLGRGGLYIAWTRARWNYSSVYCSINAYAVMPRYTWSLEVVLPRIAYHRWKHQSELSTPVPSRTWQCGQARSTIDTGHWQARRDDQGRFDRGVTRFLSCLRLIHGRPDASTHISPCHHSCLRALSTHLFISNDNSESGLHNWLRQSSNL